MNEKSEVLSVMQQYGGGFISALASAWGRADFENSAKLAAVFPELYAKYDVLTTQVKASKTR